MKSLIKALVLIYVMIFITCVMSEHDSKPISSVKVERTTYRLASK